MKRILALSFLCTPLIFLGCNKSYDEPVFKLSEPEYTIDTSTPAGMRAMDYYERTNTIILYKGLNARDFAWNFNVINIINPVIEEIKEDEVEAVLDFLDAHLFSYYSDAYMATFFPYRIPLAESVRVNTTLYNYTESEASILLSNLNKEFALLPEANQLTYIRGMHNVFLNLAAKKLERKLDEEFFRLSDYNFTIPSNSPDRPAPKSLGFWSMPTRSGNVNAPTRINDVIEWVKTIAKYTPEEIEQQFYYTEIGPNGPVQVKSPIMEAKYRYITEFLTTNYQTDLHQLALIF